MDRGLPRQQRETLTEEMPLQGFGYPRHKLYQGIIGRIGRDVYAWCAAPGDISGHGYRWRMRPKAGYQSLNAVGRGGDGERLCFADGALPKRLECRQA
jgi:hypothetical protein